MKEKRCIKFLKDNNWRRGRKGKEEGEGE